MLGIKNYEYHGITIPRPETNIRRTVGIEPAPLCFSQALINHATEVVVLFVLSITTILQLFTLHLCPT